MTLINQEQDVSSQDGSCSLVPVLLGRGTPHFTVSYVDVRDFPVPAMLQHLPSFPDNCLVCQAGRHSSPDPRIFCYGRMVWYAVLELVCYLS